MRTGIIQHELLHVLGSASVLTVLLILTCFSLLFKASFMNSLVPTETSTCLFNGKIFKMVAQEVCFSNTNIIFLSLGTQSNFNKYSEIDIDLLMTEYDYESVMHYEANAFSSNGQPTIIPTKNATAFIGQRLGMSPIDVLEVQRYYGCLALPTTTTITITMGTTVTSSTSSRSTISNEICLTMLLLVVALFGKNMLL